MMTTRQFAFLSEGSSDAALIPIIQWTFEQHCSGDVIITGERVDEARLPLKGGDPQRRVLSAVEIYACDFLVLHRDEDGMGWQNREKEIQSWCASPSLQNIKIVPMVPVQETEAWLLTDEDAIRRAVGNPHSQLGLDLPKISKLESLASPKELLIRVMEAASELSGRRLKKFDRNRSRLSIARHIEDKKVLRKLPSFRRFEDAVKKAVM